MNLDERISLARGGALDLHGTDNGARPGIDVEVEQRAVRVVSLGRHGPDGRAEEPVIAIELLENLAISWARPTAGDAPNRCHGPRSRPSRGRALRGRAGAPSGYDRPEVHLLNAVQRNEVIAKRTPPGAR